MPSENSGLASPAPPRPGAPNRKPGAGVHESPPGLVAARKNGNGTSMKFLHYTLWWGLLAFAVWVWQAPGAGDGRAAAPPGGREVVLNAPLRARLLALQRLDGPQLRPNALAGKVVIVTFFASWCPPCREEFVHLKKVYATHRHEGLEIVAVNLFENFDELSDERRLAKYLEATQPGFPVVKGDDAISAAFGTVRRIPTLLVFDRQGRSAFTFVNERNGPSVAVDPARLNAILRKIL